MSYALIVLGMQYDHLPGGVLEAEGSDQLLLPIRQLAQNTDLVIAAREWHPENHFTFSDDPQYQDQSWPPHCVQNTRGAKLHPSIRKYTDYIISMGMNRNEEHYSAFAGKTLRPVLSLEEILDKFAVETVLVAGLRGDVEVKFTALDANALGYNVVVPLDATLVRDEATYESLEKAGIAMTVSDFL